MKAIREMTDLAAASCALSAIARVADVPGVEILRGPDAVYLRIPVPFDLLDEGEPEPDPETMPAPHIDDAGRTFERDAGEPEERNWFDFWTAGRDLALAEAIFRGANLATAAAEVGFCSEDEARERWKVIRPGGLLADQEAMLKRLRAEIEEGAL